MSYKSAGRKSIFVAFVILILIAIGLPAMYCESGRKKGHMAERPGNREDRKAPLRGFPTSEGEIKVKKEVATFAAGCFWGVESVFARVPGVTRATSGFTGGRSKNPSYEDVCTGRTGHAEAVEIEYDPGKVSYEELLDVFWSIHDPTTLNRQGPDVGEQYRSVIFFHDAGQKALAKQSKKRLEDSGQLGKPVVTEIAPVGKFYKAEEYHQNYYARHGLKPVCRIPQK